MEQNNIFIPKNRADINSKIYTFLHLEESEIYQILHNETDSRGVNKFQLYGRFIGEKIKNEDNEIVFLIREINFKIINITRHVLVKQYGIDSVEVKSEINDIRDIFINLKEIPNNNDDDYEKNTHYKLINQPFAVKKNQKIDYHVNATKPDPITKNGIPCLSVAYFSV